MNHRRESIPTPSDAGSAVIGAARATPVSVTHAEDVVIVGHDLVILEADDKLEVARLGQGERMNEHGMINPGD